MKVCTTCGKEYPDEQSFCPDDGSSLKSTGGVTDLVGSIVDGKFRITKKLGEGGMGAVYLGEHVKMGRMSAIKVMSKSMANDPDAIARFNREASNASQITHNNVCGIYDFGETDDGIIYLAMEFIEGEALTDLIERESALPPKRAASILKQTAEALEAAHELKIVHRDLKPDNIMIAKSRDGTDFVKVVDFGIAKAMGGDDEGQQVTKTGLVVGTPEYMSPEQLSGDKVDGRSDTYSLALVFFRMLTGTLPFQADTAQEIMIKRLTDEPMTLADALPAGSFPPALQQAMDHALERMPSSRYSSAAQFGRDVEAAVSEMVNVAPRIDTDGATQLLDSTEITDQATAVAAAEGTAIIPGTRVSAARGAPTPDTPMPAPPPTTVTERKKTPVGAIAAVVGALVIGGGGVAVVITSGSNDPAPQDTSSQMTTNPVTPVTEPQGDQANGTDRQGGAPEPGERRPPPPTNPQPTGTERVGDTAAPGDTGVVEQPVAAGPSWMDLDRADEHLVDLLFGLTEANAAAVRDTAFDYYNATAISTSDKATAAYVMANALATLQDTDARIWAQRAVDLDGTNRSYRDLLTRLGGGSL